MGLGLPYILGLHNKGGLIGKPCTTLHMCKYGGRAGLVTKPCLTSVTPWTGARQAPLSMRFPRQEYWAGLPFPPQPRDWTPRLFHLLHWQVGSLPLSHLGNPCTSITERKNPAKFQGHFFSSVNFQTILLWELICTFFQFMTFTRLKDTYSLERKLWPT